MQTYFLFLKSYINLQTLLEGFHFNKSGIRIHPLCCHNKIMLIKKIIHLWWEQSVFWNYIYLIGRVWMCSCKISQTAYNMYVVKDNTEIEYIHRTDSEHHHAWGLPLSVDRYRTSDCTPRKTPVLKVCF